MEKVDLIIHNAGQLLTCASGGKAKKGAQMRDLEIIENGAVAVKKGKIVAAGKSSEILKKFKTENAVDASGKVISPAFVECHTHIVFAGSRFDEFELKIKGASYMDIMAAGGGITSTVKKTRAAGLMELVEQSRKRLDNLFELGVATCEVKTGYGLDTETELKMLDAIAELDKTHAVDLIPTFLAAHAFPPEFRGREDDYVDLICEEMLPIVADIRRCENNFKGLFKNKPFFVDVFCEKNAFTLEQSKRVLAAAKDLGFGLKAHVDEFTNLGGARFAIENGATSIDHLDTISDVEIKLLAASNTIGVVTPTVNFNFGATKFADARRMIDAGCAIAISTDYNPGSAPCPSLPMAMAIACRYQKLLPAEALNAVTINAAFAVGLGEKIGSLEVGKRADVLILDTTDYREICYEFGGSPVEKVLKDGKVVFEKK
ncbi:MAG: imidazolonepropionase [Acidobacteriota bacterium]|nr:imidazolonepropionase [Acidobacteriota bacterium]